MKGLAKRLTKSIGRGNLGLELARFVKLGGRQLMTITVKVGEAKTHLSDLLARVEAGEEVIIARGDEPVARLTRIEKADDLATVLAEARAARARAKPVTRQEILAWRREGARGM